MDERDIFVSREKLYEMVWATPMQRLAKDYGISDVGLAKICKKLGVPTPPRGYWAKKAAGQAGTVIKLPPKGVKQRAGVYLTRNAEPKPVIRLSNNTIDLIEHLEKPQNALKITDSLAGAHPLVRSTKQVLSKAGSSKYGVLLREKGCLDLRISKRSLRRAMLIMDALLKRLEKLGYEVTISDNGETLVLKDDVKLNIGLYERSKRFEQILTEKQKQTPWWYDKHRFEPSGELDFLLTRWPLHERHWKDTPKRNLEARLTDIVVEIVISTELVKIEMERREAERLARLEQQRSEAQRIQREIEEDGRRKELEKQASSWCKANELRAFLQACEAEFASRRPVESDVRAATWLQWAYQHADRLDPIRNGYLDKVADLECPT